MARLCEIIKMEEMKLPRECVLLRNGNIQHAGGRKEEIHGLRYHLDLFSEYENMNDAFANGDLMQHTVQNIY